MNRLVVLRLIVFLLLGLVSGQAVAVEHVEQYRTRTESGCHTSGIYPATKRIQNEETTSGYSVDVCSGTTVIFRSPRVELHPGFRANSGSTFIAGVPSFKVHFAIIDDYLGLTEADLRNEIEILNSYFVSDSGESLVNFEFGSVHTVGTLYYDYTNDIQENQDLIDAVRYDVGPPASGWYITGQPAIQNCINDSSCTILKDDSINVIIGNGNGNGFGYHNDGKPYTLWSFARLNHVGQPMEEHEMGHCFELDHTCTEYPNIFGATASNIMASKGDCPVACSTTYPSAADCSSACSLACLCSDPHDLSTCTICPDPDLTNLGGGDRNLGFNYEEYECCGTGCAPEPKTDQFYYSRTLSQTTSNNGQVGLIYWFAEKAAWGLGLPHSWACDLPMRLGNGTSDQFPDGCP